MEVAAIEGVYSVTSVDALIAVLANRVGDAVNSFWLSRQSEGFPALAIMVNGDFACVNYLPDGDTAGYVSVGHLTGLEARDTSFTISMSGEQMEVEERSVVRFSDAVAAAQEFFATNRLPRCLDWDEL